MGKQESESGANARLRAEEACGFRASGNPIALVRMGMAVLVVLALLTATLLPCVGCSGDSSNSSSEMGGRSDGGELPNNGEAELQDSAFLSGTPIQAEYESRRGDRLGAVASYDAVSDSIQASQEGKGGESSEDVGYTDGVWMWSTAACNGEYEVNDRAPSAVVADGDLVFIRSTGLDGETGAQTADPSISVVDVSSGSPTTTAVIAAQKNSYITTMYAQDGKLYVVELSVEPDNEENPWLRAKRTRLLTYEFGDPSEPKLVAETEQSGAYMAARFVDGYAYVASVYDSAWTLSEDDPAFCAPVANGVLFAPEICARRSSARWSNISLSRPFR